jgi:hypothetical protein
VAADYRRHRRARAWGKRKGGVKKAGLNNSTSILRHREER